MSRPENARVIPFVIALASCVGYAAPASAYILPADAILADMAKRRAGLGFKTLVVEGYRGTPDNPNASKVWFALEPGVGQRLEITTGGSKRLIITVGRKRWTFNEGEAPGKPERIKADAMVDFIGTPKADSGSKRGLAFLDAHKIDDEKVHLGRLGDHVAYVIGGQAADTDKPQLWVDKNLLAPIRLVTIGKDNATRSETRWLGWGSPLTGEWFPRYIEVWQDGELVERTTIVRVKVNQPLDDALFKVRSSR